MCEILVTKGGGSHFDRSAYQGARDANPDGAGFVFFQKGVNGKWEVADLGTYEAKPYSYSYYDAYGGRYNPSKNEYSSYEEWAEEQEFLKTKGFASDQDWEDWEEAPFRTTGYQTPVYQKKSHGTQPTLLLPKPKKQGDTCVTDLWEMNEDLKKDQILVTHFRMATSGGVVEHNTHPIVEGDYLVIHNGVFGYDTLPVGKSDTRKFTELLKDQAKKTKVKSTKEEQKLIEKLLKEAGGYYSIFIYSWRTNELYYFKSDLASFYWNADKRLGSTRQTRFPVVYEEAKSVKM